MIATIYEAAEMQEQLPYILNIDPTLSGEENDADDMEEEEEFIEDEDVIE